MSLAQEAALVDYRDEENEVAKSSQSVDEHENNNEKNETGGFRDFFLKPELIRALNDAGFERPSEVQQEAIHHAITGSDVLCQSKSGMGKTAVFVLSILHQLDSDKLKNEVVSFIITHARELAFQIKNEFDRFKKYLKNVRCEVFYGGVPISANAKILSDPSTVPHIIISTPGRLLALIKRKHLDPSHVKHFVIDECDKCFEKLDMRGDIQDIFTTTPQHKQVIMLSATMNEEMKAICKKFMRNPVDVIVNDQAKLTLHGLLQYYIKVAETDKNKVLGELLDKLDFNQVVIFVKSVERAKALNILLNEVSFPSIAIHSRMSQVARIQAYKEFKSFKARLMVATDLFSRGIDIDKVNIVINYDMPQSADAYLHRVGRAGRFGTKGLAITFVDNEEDTTMLNEVQSRFVAKVDEMPEEIDSSLYINQ